MTVRTCTVSVSMLRWSSPSRLAERMMCWLRDFMRSTIPRRTLSEGRKMLTCAYVTGGKAEWYRH